MRKGFNMPTPAPSADERRQQIRRVIERRTRCSVSALAELFDVTQTTVRTDLKALEAEGGIVRTHGGALAVRALERETLPSNREHLDAKRKIANKALGLVQDGDTIALDTGTTALAFAEALVQSPRTNLSIVSSDLEVLLTLEAREDFTVVGLGGAIRHGFHYAYDNVTRAALQTLRVEKYFASTSAVDLEQGLTTPHVDTAGLKANMMSISKQTYLLVDASKFGQVNFGHFANLDQMGCVVVDDGLSADILNQLEQRVESVLVAR